MKIAILGVGTVGSGVLKVLADHKALIEERIGQPVQVTQLFGRTIHNIHDVDLTGVQVVSNLEDIYESEVDLVVETLGGVDFTYQIHKELLSRGIHVVSANKDLLAQHVDELSQIANDNGAQLAYEAAVAGGIPILRTVNSSLQGERIIGIQGILNGTSNYILSKMADEGLTYAEALEGAQAAGYAEADPTSDVEGLDAQHKLALLSRLAYGLRLDEDLIQVEGIKKVSARDMAVAKDHGYAIKLVAHSQQREDGSLSLAVEPTFLPLDHPLARINGATNAVVLQATAVGQVTLVGPGAGSLETASAIVSDIVNIGREASQPNPVYDQEAQVSNDQAGDYLALLGDGAVQRVSFADGEEKKAYEKGKQVQFLYKVMGDED